MLLQYLKLFSGEIISLAALCAAILGIIKFVNTFTKWGKQRAAKKEEKRKQEISNICLELYETKIESFQANQETIFNEIFESLNSIQEKLEDIDNSKRATLETLKSLNKKVDKNEIDRIRYEILYFAAQLRHGIIDFTIDDFKHIIKIHKKYEDLLAANKMTNGQMDVEFDFIKSKYQELSEEGKF